ncbi:MAG: hypothetical protein PVG71_09725, partial [Anaerolineae bacterium]
MIALVAGDIQATAVMKGLEMSPLPCDPLTDDLLWVRVDEDVAEVREALAKLKILYAEPGQVLILLAPDEDAQA